MTTRIILINSLFLIFCKNSFAQECPDTCKLYIPNVLTPDCDDIDCEFLKIQSNCTFTEFDFKLFNRWGEIIYESTNSEEKFDSAGHKEGTYLWILSGEFCNGTKVTENGHLNIIR